MLYNPNHHPFLRRKSFKCCKILFQRYGYISIFTLGYNRIEWIDDKNLTTNSTKKFKRANQFFAIRSFFPITEIKMLMHPFNSLIILRLGANIWESPVCAFAEIAVNEHIDKFIYRVAFG